MRGVGVTALQVGHNIFVLLAVEWQILDMCHVWCHLLTTIVREMKVHRVVCMDIYFGCNERPKKRVRLYNCFGERCLLSGCLHTLTKHVFLCTGRFVKQYEDKKDISISVSKQRKIIVLLKNTDGLELRIQTNFPYSRGCSKNLPWPNRFRSVPTNDGQDWWRCYA